VDALEDYQVSTRLRIKFVVVVEYDARPENYPEDKRTPEGVLEVDLGNANEDPFIMIENGEWTITGEVLP
jgi:hypothetical protein